MLFRYGYIQRNASKSIMVDFEKGVTKGVSSKCFLPKSSIIELGR